MLRYLFGAICVLLCFTVIEQMYHGKSGIKSIRINKISSRMINVTEDLKDGNIKESETFVGDGGKNNIRKHRLPTCLIIGAMKCGTYALRSFLTVSPYIAAYDGEINFFHKEFDKGFKWYKKQMPVSTPDQITLEKSIYFLHKVAMERIYSYNKNMKLILIVRNPVKRTVSHFVHVQSHGLISEDMSLGDMVLDPNSHEIRNESLLIQASLYQPHLLEWTKYFPLSQIHIVNGDQFVKNPLPELQKVEKFLGIPPNITEKNIYFDNEKRFYCYISNNKRQCLPDRKGRKHPDMNPNVIKKLTEFYKDWNERFFKMIGRRFDWGDNQ